jgi:shikimate kinase
MARRDTVLLVGMMGAGKSTVGRALARRLGWRHLDSDEQVELRTGRTVPEIFASQGEAAFRREESLALAQGLASGPGVVISVAGGAVLDPENRRRLADGGTVVWLRAGVDTLAARVGGGEGRPLLGDDPGTALVHLYQQRRPLYEELADVVVDVDGLTPQESVEQILERLG